MAKKKREDMNETAHRVFQDFLKIADKPDKKEKQSVISQPAKKQKQP